MVPVPIVKAMVMLLELTLIWLFPTPDSQSTKMPFFAWRGESMSCYRDQLVNNAYKFDFPIHKPWFELSEAQKQLVWDGNEYFEGLT